MMSAPFDDERLNGRVALVTGASRGIGKAACPPGPLVAGEYALVVHAVDAGRAPHPSGLKAQA
jgi:NAD(P)-dependent dehydrogenase (short-subunit alcohol dehydrogenase family)